jgi:hypothetical protein
MTKKHFIALADAIRDCNYPPPGFTRQPFTAEQLEYLADFCERQNRDFSRERWLAYIAGECGPNGGKR